MSAQREPNTVPAITAGSVLDVLGVEMILLETSAPADYDYHPALHVYGRAKPEKGETRFVLVPLTDVAFQEMRYRSGLYTVERSTFFAPEQLREMLWKALFTGALKV